MTNKITIKHIKVIGIWEIVFISISFIYWFFKTDGHVQDLSDTFFICGAIFFCIGSVIMLTSNSRGHYYKYLRESSGGTVEGYQKDKQTDIEDRKRHSRYGCYMLCAGLLGFIWSGLLLLT